MEQTNCIDDEDIPEEIKITAEEASSSLLPAKSRSRYEKAHAAFLEWRHNVQELSKSFAPSSLWSIVSMLKASLLIKEKIDISQYCQVCALLKRKSEGYNPKKSKILSGEQIRQFLLQAPNEVYLLIKVILFFGVYGLSRREELTLLSTYDIEDTETHVIVLLRDTKNHTARRFVVTDDGSDFQPYSLYRNYAAL